ncbi:MAG: taurine catabolism dioxygenase TauD, partial [Thiothrix sp.]
DGIVVRPAQSGPVFSVTAAGHLHMRYSARQRNVIWRDDPATQAAAQFLLNLWQQDSIYKIRYTLQAGEGVLCNNVLHCRTAFVDSPEPAKQRLLYRGRYYDRIAEPTPQMEECVC